MNIINLVPSLNDAGQALPQQSYLHEADSQLQSFTDYLEKSVNSLESPKSDENKQAQILDESEKTQHAMQSADQKKDGEEKPTKTAHWAKRNKPLTEVKKQNKNNSTEKIAHKLLDEKDGIKGMHKEDFVQRKENLSKDEVLEEMKNKELGKQEEDSLIETMPVLEETNTVSGIESKVGQDSSKDTRKTDNDKRVLESSQSEKNITDDEKKAILLDKLSSRNLSEEELKELKAFLEKKNAADQQNLSLLSEARPAQKDTKLSEKQDSKRVFKSVLNSKNNLIHGTKTRKHADKKAERANVETAISQNSHKENSELVQNLQRSEANPQQPTDVRTELPLSASERQAFLNELKERMNADIVKDSTLVLKKDGAGEIRLILRPERMGQVRIRLLLEDNHIGGKIIVDNSSVRDIFTENLDSLKEAFENSGFQFEGMDVSVGGEESQDNFSKNNDQQYRPDLVELLEGSMTLIDEGNDDQALVNMII